MNIAAANIINPSGLKRLMNDDKKSEQFLIAVENGLLIDYLDAKHYEGINYARMLTLDLNSITKQNIDKLKTADFTDGEILEINQVTSYFNYVNRSVIGLGVNIDGDVLGLSPNISDDPKNWNHQ